MAEYGLLGPVVVSVDGHDLDTGSPQQRAVLAALLVDAGRPVRPETLIERVWGATPPDGARRALHALLARVRRLLERAETAGSALPLRPGGYLPIVEPERVDLHGFTALVAAAQEHGCAAADRAALYRKALDRWRGPALADVPGDWAARTREAWQRRRLDAEAAWAGVLTGLGRPLEVVDPLRASFVEHPTAEPLVGALMRALGAAGRDAEALECYAIARARLREELGADPGAELNRVHDALLRGTLAVPAPVVAGRPGAPSQLPAEASGFVGRKAELDQLDQAAWDAAVVIAGAAGVGKTALAVRWARQARSRFPDGRLYVNLRGYDPGRPMAAGGALTRFLTALGVPAPEVPIDLDERAARYRTEVDGRRMLVLLDNAGDAEQVRPLLPGTASCLVLVTSRDAMSGLVAVDGARRLDLGLLPLDDAIALLAGLISRRSDAEPGVLAAIAERCGRLPLALRVAAELANTHPELRPADLAAALADRQGRLDVLQIGGDHRAAVRSVLSWSVEQLEPGTARAFGLLGLHPGPDLTDTAAAALLGTDRHRAGDHLDALVRAHLAHRNAPGRVGMHDLPRAYAVERATADADGGAARSRLVEYYRQGATDAVGALYPAGPAAATAMAWLDAEAANLLAVAETGGPEVAVDLSAVLHRHLRTRGRYVEAHALHTQVLAVARGVGDLASQAQVLCRLGDCYYLQGQHDQAMESYHLALDLSTEIGDRATERAALTGLGDGHRTEGMHVQALDCYQRALAIARETGDRAGERAVLCGLGDAHRLHGRVEPAVDCLEQALTIARELRDLNGERTALCGLGDLSQLTGDPGTAIRLYEQGLEIARRAGNRGGQLDALRCLGDLNATLDRFEPATDCLEQAIAIARETADADGEAEVLCGFGGLHRRQRELDRAAAAYQQAWEIARQSGYRHVEYEAAQGLARVDLDAGRYEPALTRYRTALGLAEELTQPAAEARSHDGLARAHRASSDQHQARQHWQRTLEILTELGVSAVEDVREADIRRALAEFAPGPAR